jgi:L-serine deaminase
MENIFTNLSNDELQLNGGGVVGALVGGILGFDAGVLSGIIYTVATNDYKDLGKNIRNAASAGAVTCACAGAFVPL